MLALLAFLTAISRSFAASVWNKFVSGPHCNSFDPLLEC